MRPFILRLHLYAGLLCFPYFLIFGISSLHINHRFSGMEPSMNDSIQWQGPLSRPAFQSNEQFAEEIRIRLGLMGWTPPWVQKKDSASFAFMVTHAGKDYHINVPLLGHVVQVNEKRKGFWSVFNSLHFLGEAIPGAPWLINTWRFYQDLTVVVLLFSVGSGIYIFLRRRQERKAAFLLLGSALALSFLFMLTIWL